MHDLAAAAADGAARPPLGPAPDPHAPVRIAAYSARFAAERLVNMLDAIGAWSERADDGFSVWVPAGRWPARVRVLQLQDSRTTLDGTLLSVELGGVYGPPSWPYTVQFDSPPPHCPDWNPRGVARAHIIEFLAPESP